MKKLYTILAAVLLTATTYAQAPEKMSYQAVIRDSGDALVTSQAVGMQISILQGSTPVYVETQTPTTNVNGLVSLEIGTGTTSDDFTTIDWAAGPYFIKTETDPTGGSSYSITGTSQLLSVPFALYSANTAGLDLKADKSSPTFTGDVVFDTNGVNFNGGNVAFDNGQTFVRSAQVFNSAENIFYGPSVEFNTATNFATGILKILNSPQTAGSVLTDVNGDGIATWQSPVTSAIADGSITEAQLAFDTATQTELNLKADIDSPTFTGNVDMGSNLNVVGDMSLGGNMSFNGGLSFNSWDIYSNPGIFSINESGVAPHFNIIPGGNVGIGTSSPQAPFDVRTSTTTTGVAVFKNDLPTWAYISIGNQTTGASGGNGLMLGYTPSNEALIRNLYNSPMSFWTNNLERIRISADGNVGIGINNPTAKLDIAGTLKISDGTEGAGKVLTSDADGNASWQANNALLTTYEATSGAVNPLSADVTGSLIYTQNTEYPNFPEDLPDGFTCTIINYSNYLFTSNVLTTAVFVTDVTGNAGASSFTIPSGGSVNVYVMTNPNSAQKLYYIK